MMTPLSTTKSTTRSNKTTTTTSFGSTIHRRSSNHSLVRSLMLIMSSSFLCGQLVTSTKATGVRQTTRRLAATTTGRRNDGFGRSSSMLSSLSVSSSSTMGFVMAPISSPCYQRQQQQSTFATRPTLSSMCFLGEAARTTTSKQNALLSSLRNSERYIAVTPVMQQQRPSGSNFYSSSSSALFTASTSSPASSTETDQVTEDDSNTNNNMDKNDDSSSIKSIAWLRELVVDTLNELYDPADVAKGAVLAKYEEKGNKKKKKKKGSSEDVLEEEKPTGPSKEEIDAMAQEAYDRAKGTKFTTMDAMVTKATKPEFGDYQVNAAMGLAKNLGLQSPRQCAQEIVDALKPKLLGIMEEPDIAGPGFINLKYTSEYLSNTIQCMAQDANGRLAIPKTSPTQKVVVDYSSPNIAKEMHVGHLRSTIIGDTLSNIMEFAGHDVVRLNHVGDWGTQFGMLVEHLRDHYPQALSRDSNEKVDLGDLVVLYKAAKKRFDDDEDFKTRARESVVKLQGGDEESLRAWEALCDASREEFQKIYSRLNINPNLMERGESFYNPYLSDVVENLKEQNLAVESEGATVIFLDGYENRDGSPLPMLIQKSDGGYNYATTDLAAIQHRLKEENADRVLYVTDAGQSQHFDMVFEAAKKASLFSPSEASLEHVPFGLVQGEDGKKFATRSGDTVKLKDLLDESVRIVSQDILSRKEDSSDKLTENEQIVANVVGIAAVKYADLSMNRTSNYKFSYERMLSLNGNTAPYMLYAYARICGIIRKAIGEEQGGSTEMIWPDASSTILLKEDAELQLARNLIKLPDVLKEVEDDLFPNVLCDYLFTTSQLFNKFYETCSVNQAETSELKSSRLTLCTVTACTIRLLMNLLGIQVLERL